MKHFYPYAGIVLRAFAAALSVAGLLFLASGCATVPKKVPSPPATTEGATEPQPEPEREPQPARPAPVPPVVAKPPRITEPAPKPEPEVPVVSVPPQPGRLSIRIESNPAGAMIVIDGRPVGRAPVNADFDAVNNGFFKDPVTIRARFLASDANSESRTVEERLGPLDRIPQTILFSPDGAQRVIRQY